MHTSGHLRNWGSSATSRRCRLDALPRFNPDQYQPRLDRAHLSAGLLICSGGVDRIRGEGLEG